MGRAEEHAAYRAEVERLNDAATVAEPDYTSVQRADWEAGLLLPESKRPAYYTAMLDAYFTGVDPSPRLTKDARKAFASVSPRIKRARATAIGKRKANRKCNAVDGRGCVADPTENDSKTIQKRFKNDSNSVSVSGSESGSDLNVGKAQRAGETWRGHTEVHTEAHSDVLPITYYLLPTTDVNQTPLEGGLVNDRVEGFNEIDAQPDTPAREEPRPFTRPTPAQVQGWWSAEGREWAGTTEGERAAREFIAESADRVKPPKRKKVNPFTNPYDPKKAGDELKRAWRGLASVWAGSYERRRATA